MTRSLISIWFDPSYFQVLFLLDKIFSKLKRKIIWLINVLKLLIIGPNLIIFRNIVYYQNKSKWIHWLNPIDIQPRDLYNGKRFYRFSVFDYRFCFTEGVPSYQIESCRLWQTQLTAVLKLCHVGLKGDSDGRGERNRRCFCVRMVGAHYSLHYGRGRHEFSGKWRTCVW